MSERTAKKMLEKMEAVMTDADDFDPKDLVAKERSLRAKEYARKALAAEGEGWWLYAEMYAKKAIDYMEGNL